MNEGRTSCPHCGPESVSGLKGGQDDRQRQAERAEADRAAYIQYSIRQAVPRYRALVDSMADFYKLMVTFQVAMEELLAEANELEP